MIKTSQNIFLVAATALALSACSSTPKPETEMALSTSALQNAELAGAKKYAPIELRTAQEKQDLANAALAEEHHTTARYLSEQAAVDAELAKAKSEAEKSRLALTEVKDSIALIKTELDRSVDQ